MIAFLIVITLLFFCTDTDTALNFAVANNNMAAALTYHFFHRSATHLVINALSLTLIYKPVKKTFSNNRINTAVLPVMAYAVATVAALCAAKQTPTVGASGLIYAILGMHLALTKGYRQHFFVWATIILQTFLGNSNVILHFCAYTIAIASMCILQFVSQINTYKNEINQNKNL